MNKVCKENDLDTEACRLLNSTDPTICQNNCIATTLCPSFCGTCRKYRLSCIVKCFIVFNKHIRILIICIWEVTTHLIYFFSVNCKDCKSVSDTSECSNNTLCKTEQVRFIFVRSNLLYVQNILVQAYNVRFNIWKVNQFQCQFCTWHFYLYHQTEGNNCSVLA